MVESGGSWRRSRPCAILLASDTPWVREAERIIRTHGYAVAKLRDLHYADLVVGPGELKVVLVAATLHGPSVASHIARLRSRNADLLVIVLGGGSRDAEPSADGSGSVYLPEPFDGNQLRRILPPVAPGPPA